MSKQSKKQRKRRERQKKQRRRKLVTLFNSLYPNAPAGTAGQVVAVALSLSRYPDFQQSQTALLQEAVLQYVQTEQTDYSRHVDDYIEAVLDSLAEGRFYAGQRPDTLAHESKQKALKIISSWQ